MKFWNVLILVGLLSGAANAEDKTHVHQDGMKHAAQMSDAVLPTEGGQSAFAALQEIVTLLEADPKTNWSNVNIEALRQHLIDMNNVTLDTTISAIQNGNSITFSVLGEGPVVGSIQRMVMGHVMTMNGVDGWKLAAEAVEKGATMTVTPPDQNSMAKLQALGFIGVMARGTHHQQHHWMLANGMMPHQ